MWRLSNGAKQEPVVVKHSWVVARAIKKALSDIEKEVALSAWDEECLFDVLLQEVEKNARKIVNSKFI